MIKNMTIKYDMSLDEIGAKMFHKCRFVYN